MTTTTHSIEDWATEAVVALEQTAVGLLASGTVTAGDSRPPALREDHSWGALIQFMCETETVQLALFTSHDSCAAMAAAMLYEDPSALSDSDISDAMGEIVNIVGGLLEQAVQEWSPTVELGLPIVFEGRIVPPHGMHSISIPVAIDDIEVELLINHGARTTTEAVA